MKLNFGGAQSWAVSDDDFQLAQASDTLCAGAVFELNTGAGPNSNSPSWVIGDTFLKNVYSVFRFSPPSVGFATLVTDGSGSGNLVSGNGALSQTVPSLLVALGASLGAYFLS